MNNRCPQCGSMAIVTQDIEVLANATVLSKTEKRIQLSCQDCGWMGTDEPAVSAGKDYPSGE